MYRILVVDDEPMIRKGLKKLLEQAQTISTHIITAENGVHALEIIEQETPDFLFTDIRMPRMDGLELCKRVSEQYSAVCIAVITGYGDFQYAKECIRYGVIDYVLKPINKKNINDVLQRMVEKSNQKRGNHYLSLTKLQEWVEKLGEAVWYLKTEELKELTGQCIADFSVHLFNSERQQEFIEELNQFLIKAILEKDQTFQGPDFELKGQTLAEKTDAFLERWLHVVNLLREKRKRNIKDPVEEAKQYIEEHLAKEVSLEEVAEKLGLNASYFSQLFKQRTDETFIQYRIRRRLEKAKRLLEKPHYRITDISYEIGYADHPHFTKTFKKYTGMSPSQYRKMLGIE